MATIRMNADQKKSILLEMIRTSRTFFKISELENLGAKKGIVQNTIKDMVQQLVDDGLVMSEKVGVSVLYWSFQSNEVQKKTLKYESLKNSCEEMVEEIRSKETYVSSERESKEHTREREELEQRLSTLNKKEEEQKTELELFSETDPVVYDKLVSEREAMADECNRIIDNIFIVQDYVCSKFSMEKSEFNSSFSVPQDLDYVQ